MGPRESERTGQIESCAYDDYKLGAFIPKIAATLIYTKTLTTRY